MTQPTATTAQLADYLINGYWAFNGEIAHHWSVTSVSYNIDGLNAAEQFLAVSALSAWHDVANLSFFQVHTAAQITYSHAGAMQAYTNDSYSGSGILSSAAVNISADWITSDGGARDGKTGIDSYGYQTYLHETGHALGLGHQGAYNGSATYGVDNVYANDTWQYSIMSYFSEQNFGGDSYRYAVTPQMADIAAMATIYGGATTRAGDTTYGFHSTAGSVFDFSSYTSAPEMTIVDSGGSDTLDCSGYTQAQNLDLNPGAFCSVGGLVHNIGIATSVLIENVIGGSGNDLIAGNILNNVLHGGAGDDTIYGGSGSDVLYGDGGNDFLDGGAGSDTAVFDGTRAQHDVVLLANGGINVIDLRAGSPTGTDRLFNVEWLMFSDGTFSSDGYQHGGVLAQGQTFYGTASASTFIGTSGIDTVSYQNAAAGVIINLGGNAVWHGVTDTLLSIENAIGSPFADSLFGDAGDNVLDGGAGGGDRFYGNGGNDTVSFAHSDASAIVRLSAHATWNGSAGEVWGVSNVIGSAFSDAIFGDAGDNVLDGGASGGDRFFGNGGNDTLSFAHCDASTIVRLSAYATWNGSAGEVWGVSNVIGSAFSDTIFGDAGDNVLDGGAAGGDRFYGNGGNDTVSFAHSDASAIVRLSAHATWNGSAGEVWGVSNVIGSAFSDTIFGDGGDNVLDGGAGGGDRFYGNGGNDTVSFAHSNTSAIVRLSAHATWNGSAGEVWDIENVTGSAFNDTIFGDAGGNVINGGPGADYMVGGAGNDTFVFKRGEASGDTIGEFSGNGSGVGDQLHFIGYGLASEGATFTQIDTTHWSVNSADGLFHEPITFSSAVPVHPSDYFFT